MYVRVYGADMVCRLIETCFLIHILRSISKVLGASSFCTCVEYIMLGLVLFHSDFFFFFFFLHVALNISFILRRQTYAIQDAISIPNASNLSKSPIVKVIRPQAPAFIAGNVYLRHAPQVDLRMTT